MTVWDVTARPDHEQFGYWHEVICQAFVPLTPHRTDDAPGFAARVETRPLHRVVRAHIRSRPQRTTHGPSEVSRTDGAYYFVNLQVAGRCAVRQGATESVVGPGQFTVVDTSEPYHFDFDAPWQMLSYRLPHDVLDGRPSALGRRLGGCFDAAGPGRVVASILTSLWDVDTTAGPAADLEHALASAVTATVAGGPVPDRPRDLLRAAVLRHVRGRLGDRTLSVRSVCRRFGIAPRTLHAAFADGNGSFAATVRRLRLERSAALLADPDTTATVTAVALACGFDDPASFSRAFRREFGCTPTEVRRSGGARTAQPPCAQ
ncbi:helix-turn-helix domain-containing protein [Pseudonocardia sp.]|uniref:AraC-like ligand-binding domain-containing protein n=1 Tax=Pseudonocardia sp. TaxID=60912 RepID=UPI00260EE33D|nr:helix-turn-helix domain-containing protein [Pseudonocardia sp.]